MFGKQGAAASFPIGAEMTLTYTPAALPFRMAGGLWDVADHRIALKSAYPRLAAAIGQAWRLAGDVYDTATHFRFPDGRILRKGATVTAPVNADYPLTITNAQALALGFGGSIPTPASQTARHVTTGTLPGDTTFISTTDTAAPQLVDIGSGKKAVEFVVTAEQITTAGRVEFYAGLSNAATGANIVRFMTNSAAPALHELAVFRGTDLVGLVAPYDPGTHILGLEFDAGAGTFRALLDGVPMVLSDNAYTEINNARIQITAFERPNVNSGKIYEATARTSADVISLTGGFASDATDIAGNLISGRKKWTSNTGERAGSANSGGHAITLDDLPNIDLPLSLVGTTIGGIGNISVDRRDTDGNGVANMGAGNVAKLNGGGLAHTHTIAPPTVDVLRVVRVA